MKVEQLNHNGLTWQKITRPTKHELSPALKSYDFHDLHIEACLPPIQRPRLESCEHYLFMILTFPIFRQKERRMSHVEVDFFITKDLVITVQDKSYKPLDELFNKIKGNKKELNRIFKNSPGHLLYEILNNCLLKSFPLLNEINQDLELIEKKLFNGMNKGMIKHILSATHNIVDFRKTITAHKTVIRQLISKSEPFFSLNGQKDYYDDLINYTKEIWDSLENYKDTVTALQQSHDSLYQWRLNEVIKTLTIFSIVIFSITFTAAVFAMANDNGMPFLNTPFNFWKTLGVIAIVGSGVFMIFKRKRWI